MTVGEILRFFANRHPDKVAIHDRDKTITYGHFNQRVNRLANTFLSQGFKPNENISIMLRNCSEYMEIVFALAKIGVTCVPINVRLVGEEIKYIMNNSDSRALILEEEFIEKISPIMKDLKCEQDQYYLVGKRAWESAVPYEKLFEGSSPEEPSVQVEETSGLMSNLVLFFS